MEKILAIIPARGGSKGIPHKNIKKINGKPLIHYTIVQAKKSKYISKIVVSSDDEKILSYSKKSKVDVIKRPKKLSTGTARSEDVYKHVIQHYDKLNQFFDTIVILQPTSPLRIKNDIDNAINKFRKSNSDIVLSVYPAPFPPEWYFLIKNRKLKFFINKKKVKRRQDYDKFYIPNGSVFVTSKNHILKDSKFLSDNISPFIMPEERSLDIDTLFDFKLAKMLLKKIK
jgi:CMP-N,N'-diacetyllegionaminic acid synthase